MKVTRNLRLTIFVQFDYGVFNFVSTQCLFNLEWVKLCLREKSMHTLRQNGHLVLLKRITAAESMVLWSHPETSLIGGIWFDWKKGNTRQLVYKREKRCATNKSNWWRCKSIEKFNQITTVISSNKIPWPITVHLQKIWHISMVPDI